MIWIVVLEKRSRGREIWLNEYFVAIAQNLRGYDVCVMMSTFNGEKYLEEQLHSLINQKDVSIKIKIRDDGSTDGTRNILEKHENQYPFTSVDYGNNLGYARSFSRLVAIAGDHDYYAFSDQDDVWSEDKLAIACKGINAEKSCDRPILYSCSLTLVDESLKIIAEMEKTTEQAFSKGRYIIDKYSYRYAMVFNRDLRNKFIQYRNCEEISHDNLTGLIEVVLGIFIFGYKSYIKYRQHSNNVVGGSNGWINTWKRRMRVINRAKQFSRVTIAKNLLETYSDDFRDIHDGEILKTIAEYKDSFRKKMKLLFNREIRRDSTEKNLLFKVCVLFSLA